MKREFYEKLNSAVRQKGIENPVKWLNDIITLAVFIYYPVLLILLYIREYADILRMIFVPLAAFIIVSISRYFLNFRRPYEEMNILPIAASKKSGKSFPSRHTFSIFMIALCSLHFNIPLGTALLIIGVFLAVLRVVCGVHYIRDVVAGTLFAAAAYIIGFICL